MQTNWQQYALAAVRDLEKALRLRGMDQGRDSLNVMRALEDAKGNVLVAIAALVDAEAGTGEEQ